LTPRILDKVIKRILGAPISIHRENLQLETGIENIDTILETRQVMYYHKVMNTETLVQNKIWNTNNEWAK